MYILELGGRKFKTTTTTVAAAEAPEAATTTSTFITWSGLRHRQKAPLYPLGIHRPLINCLLQYTLQRAIHCLMYDNTIFLF